MHLRWETIQLDLCKTFRTAHGSSAYRRNVFVALEDGLGEAAGVAYHGESERGITAALQAIAAQLRDEPIQLPSAALARLPGPSSSAAARAALDLALHDLWGKQLGQPLHRLLELDPARAPLTSYTIALDEPHVMAAQAQQTALPILKLKLGGPDDEAIVEAVRNVSTARLRVDANSGWSREQAARLIPRLAAWGVELVEQPLATGDVEGLRWLRHQRFGVPIFADENIRTARDVVAHAGAVDGVVIKLMKSGGIQGALQAIAVAHALDLEVMIGCMVESSLGVTAAAHLAPLCEHADLDGPLLIANDPYRGLHYAGAQLVLPPGPGLGVVPARVS